MGAVTDRRALLALVLAAAGLWHVLALLVPERPPAPAGSVGRDYATYHYAAKVALAGGDPYDTASLDAAAAAEGVRRNAVHPWIYPPAAVFAFVWAPAVDLETGLAIWRVLSELALLGTIAVLALGWSELDPTEVLATLAVSLALLSGVAYGHHLGQANNAVLFLAMSGVVLVRRSQWAGGVLVGLAVMGKLAPLVFVGLFLVEGRFRAVAAALATGLVASVASLLVVGPAGQASFWGRVVPGLGSGDYNGLTIRIGMFGNHSVPGVLDQLAPGGDTLSTPARIGSFAVLVALGGAMAALFFWRSTDPVVRAARVGAASAAMLLVPVYTFDHHLVWLAPAFVAVWAALRSGRLPWWAAVPAGLAFAVLCLPTPPMRRLAGYYGGLPGLLVQEAPHLGIWVFFALSAWAGRGRPEAFH